MNTFKQFVLLFLSIGAANTGLRVFGIDLIEFLFGTSFFSNIIYAGVGVSAIVGVFVLLFDKKSF